MAYHTRIILSFLLFCTCVHSLCYFPNGAVSSQDTPCRDDIAESTCCGQGYACLTNNMCMATGKELQKPGATRFVRGSCTDKSWRSGNCPNFCADPEKDNTGGGMGISQCPGTYKLFYCIDGGMDQVDCEKQQNVLIFQDDPKIYTTIGVVPKPATTTTSSSSSTTTEPASSTTNETLASEQSSAITTSTASSTSTEIATAGLSQSAKIGIGVGVTLGAILIFTCLGLALYFYKRSKKAAHSVVESQYPPTYSASMQPVAVDSYKQASGQGHTQQWPLHEVSGERSSQRYELPASGH